MSSLPLEVEIDRKLLLSKEAQENLAVGARTLLGTKGFATRSKNAMKGLLALLLGARSY